MLTPGVVGGAGDREAASRPLWTPDDSHALLVLDGAVSHRLLNVARHYGAANRKSVGHLDGAVPRDGDAACRDGAARPQSTVEPVLSQGVATVTVPVRESAHSAVTVRVPVVAPLGSSVRVVVVTLLAVAAGADRGRLDRLTE